MMEKGKVQVLKYSKRVIKGVSGVVKIPLIMKLVKLVRTLYRARVPYSKRAVMVRDQFTCAYCGKKGKNMTIDHVIPSSKGGKTNFENCVTACKSCNNNKGDMLPSECRMYLTFKPYQPTVMEFLQLKMKKLGIKEMLDELYKEL